MSDDEAGDEGTAGASGKEAPEVTKEEKQEVVKKVIPPTQKGTKNKQGDYIVEKFEIPDIRDEAKRAGDNAGDDDDDDDSSEVSYGDEDDQQEQPKKEEASAADKQAEGKSFIQTRLL